MSGHRDNGTERGDLKILVLLCADLESLGCGLDCAEVRGWLDSRGLAVETQAVSDLCRRPETIAETTAQAGAQRLVLGLCSREYPRIELHAHARKVGLDPFGVEVVNLGAYCTLHPRLVATDKAKVLLEAAVARARMFTGCPPDSVKPVISWDQTLSRRALFTLPPLQYEPVPSIRRGDCAFDDGCRVCATTCPWQALDPSDGLMVLDKNRCTGCGACVSACPQTAIDLPGVSPEQIRAQMTTLLRGASLSASPRAILFVCARSVGVLDALAQKGLSYPAEWFPVEVPCVGMVTPGWLLQCLAAGAVATGVLPCQRNDCRFGQAEVTEGRVAYCRSFLHMVGAPPDAVRLFDPRDERELAQALSAWAEPEPHKGSHEHPVRETPLFTPRATAQALLGIAKRFAASTNGSLAHAHSPVGVVHVDQGCTMCEGCVQACPTGALSMGCEEETRALTFDAGICIGCEACAPVCPEKVVRVMKATDLGRLGQGTLTLYRDREIRCEACGAPVAPGTMLQRIAGMLGAEDATALSFISRFCTTCRGSFAAGGWHGRDTPGPPQWDEPGAGDRGVSVN